ncbi:TPA: hypothetical protein SLN52_000610 [Serratia marcescens]|uniref:hypothetical protein n=1 Tax=Serratia marcescens TaxID=615 RepID=UPI0002AF40EF|nr:hypothetical protein [Serratia marcescens]AGE17642.1 hypothetical protein SMWW4_v1c18390 [Serratia marcescens WW4]HEI9791850.1 hypothetical protein [Serratia marcescens]
MAWYDITGTIADWTMAGAAVYAAVNAKQWFSQRSHTKGFDKAENILSAIDNHYRERNRYLSEIHSALEYLNALDSNLIFADQEMQDRHEKLSKQHSGNILLVDGLSDELVLIERWSITVLNPEKINAVIKSLRNLNASAANAYNYSRSCIYNLICVSRQDFEFTLTQFKSQYEDFLKDLATLDDCYENFKKQKFTNFFRVS